MHFTSVDAVIVRKLLTSKTVDLYDFYTEYRYSPLQMSDSIGRLTKINLISESEGNIQRNTEFHQILLRFRQQIYRRTLPWKTIPEEFLRIDHREMKDFIPTFRDFNGV